MMIGILKYLSVWQLAKYQDHIIMSTSDFSEAQTKTHDRGYQQGRAEAIDEFAEAIRKYIGNNGVIPINIIAKRLKEQKHEN